MKSEPAQRDEPEDRPGAGPSRTGAGAMKRGLELFRYVASIGAVQREITAGTGDLVDWATGLPTTFWLSDTTEVISAGGLV